MEKTNFFFLLKSSFSFLCKIVKTPDVPKELFTLAAVLPEISPLSPVISKPGCPTEAPQELFRNSYNQVSPQTSEMTKARGGSQTSFFVCSVSNPK